MSEPNYPKMIDEIVEHLEKIMSSLSDQYHDDAVTVACTIANIISHHGGKNVFEEEIENEED